MGDFGRYHSCDIDLFGKTHLVYFDLDTYNLHYARGDGIGLWYKEVIKNIGSSRGCCDIAVDSNGFPHILHVDSVTYRYWDGNQWVEQTGLGGGDICAALTLDSNNYPHIVYLRNSSGPWYIFYKYWDGFSWIETPIEAQSLDDLSANSSLTIRLDSNNYPHVMFTSPFTFTQGIHFKIFRWTGSSWNIKLFPNSYYVNPTQRSFAIDKNDVDHTAYTEWEELPAGDTGNFKYVTWDGSIETTYDCPLGVFRRASFYSRNGSVFMVSSPDTKHIKTYELQGTEWDIRNVSVAPWWTDYNSSIERDERVSICYTSCNFYGSNNRSLLCVKSNEPIELGSSSSSLP